MAKSKGRTQRPQRTSRNSAKAEVDTTTSANDDVEAVEDVQTKGTEDELADTTPAKDETLSDEVEDADADADA